MFHAGTAKLQSNKKNLAIRSATPLRLSNKATA
jgi:hypothetical protein